MSAVLGHSSIEYFAKLQRESLDEEARHRNEVKVVARLETHAMRRWYIEGANGVRERRGQEAAERLRRDVWAYPNNVVITQ